MNAMDEKHLTYHLVSLSKYRKAVFEEQVDSLLKGVCPKMEKG
jgi:putative transposase